MPFWTASGHLVAWLDLCTSEKRAGKSRQKLRGLLSQRCDRVGRWEKYQSSSHGKEKKKGFWSEMPFWTASGHLVAWLDL